MRRARGYTLIELVLVLLVVGVTTLIAVRQVQLHLDRIEARNAIRSAGATFARAREEALTQQTPVSIRVDTSADALDLFSRYGRITTVPLGITHRVALSTTRDSVTFDVRGLGYGAANLTLVARRGRAAETLTVSRLGRVRY